MKDRDTRGEGMGAQARYEDYGALIRDIEDISRITTGDAETGEQKSLLATTVIESMTDAVMLVDMNARVLYVNSALEELLGDSAANLVGMSALDLPTYRELKDRARATQALKRVISKGTAETVDASIINRDGVEVPLNVTASVMRDASGKAETLVVVLRSVSERRAIEEALRESEELSTAMLETTETGIYLLQDGRFRYVNRRFEELSGFSREELIGTYSLDLIHEDDRAAARSKAIEVLKGVGSLPYEFRLRTKNLEYIWVLDRVKSIQYEGRRSVLGSLMDIDDAKKREIEIVEYTKQIETLFNIGKLVSQTLNLNELLDVVLEEVLKIVGATSAGIFLVDRESGELVLRSHKGASDELVERAELLRSRLGLTGDVLLRKPLIFRDLEAHPELEELRQEGLKSFAAFPLAAKEKTLGLLVIGSENRGHFSENEKLLINIIANQIGMAIENAQLYERALELAFTDWLTGLYNRRYLMEEIEREFGRAARSRSCLSLVMVDLDGLKGINDRFGHIGGDALLKEVGRVVKSNTRISDTAARWGGDEFMILVPEAGTDESRSIGERIRSQVESIRKHLSGQEVGISISVGIAAFPENGGDADELLQRVDEALYCAKRDGKNRVHTCTSRRKDNAS